MLEWWREGEIDAKRIRDSGVMYYFGESWRGH